jgi:hypothetical protein
MSAIFVFVLLLSSYWFFTPDLSKCVVNSDQSCTAFREMAEEKVPQDSYTCIDRLPKLTSMESLVDTKRHKVPQLCSRCKELTKTWNLSKLKWREVEDGAQRLDCPLCQMIIGSLPGVTAVLSHGMNAKTSSKSKDITHAVLKVGRLDGK